MLMKALGGQGGSTHFTPIIYQPIVGFTDSTSRVRQPHSQAGEVAKEAWSDRPLRRWVCKTVVCSVVIFR